MPCIECITFAICKGQDINDLLNKCPKLKKFMEASLKNFDLAHEIMTDINSFTPK